MKNFVKITVFSALLGLILTASAFSEYKKPVKYPLGFRHGMNHEEAEKVLKNLDAEIVENSDRSILALYDKTYFGVKIQDISLRFNDDGLQSVSLRTDGEESDEKNNKRLKEFSKLIRDIYDVNERANGSSIDTTSDIKTRFVSRYENGSYELLVYSFYLKDKYYLTLNFEKFF
jgi:hypothetical protein